MTEAVEFRPAALFTSAVLVGVLTSAAKLAGAAKTIVIARYFGASDALDAFLIAFLLPSFVSDLISGSLTASLVPLLVRRGSRDAQRLASSVLLGALLLMLVLAGGLALGGRRLLTITASGFSEDKLRLTTALFLGLLWWLPMSACIAVWRALLNANRRFAIAAIAPIASPLLCIGLLVVATRRWGIGVLCVGTVGGVAVECLILAIALSRLGYPIRPRWHSDCISDITYLGRQYLPLMISAGIASASILVDQSIAARLGPGQVSALVYGTRLTTVVLQAVAMPIGITMLPVLSRLTAAADWTRLRKTILSYGAMVALLSIPLAVILSAGSNVLVRAFFERGAFSSEAVNTVAYVQQFSVLQIPFVLLLTLATRVASATSANILLAWVGTGALVLNLVLDVVFSRALGVGGIAVSTVVVQMGSVAALAVLLYRRQPELWRSVR